MTTMPNVDSIAATIAAMPVEAVNLRMWATARDLGATSTGRAVIVFFAVFAEVKIARGVAVVDFDTLALTTALPPRSVLAAFASLERAGLVLAEKIDRRKRRVTLPCLLPEIPHGRERRSGLIESHTVH